MIAWMQPQALWGLLAAAAAVVVHLLFRARGVRLTFPSLRFVHASPVAALRMRRPSDLLLLAVRTVMLATAAIALAQPLVLTGGRIRGWNGRTARAIVVDSSAGMREAAADVDATVLAESRSAVAWTRFDTKDLPQGIQHAVEWLETAPPARREIVVVSNFRRGALGASDVGLVGPATGLRLLRVGALPPRREIEGVPRLDRDAVAESHVLLEGAATALVVVRTGTAARGLEIVASPASRDAVQKLRRVVAAAGAPAPDPAQPILVMLDGARIDMPFREVSSGWMLRAVLAIQHDRDLAALGSVAGSPASPAPWLTLLTGGGGRALVRAASAGEHLVLDVAATPADLLAAAAVRAALIARNPSKGRSEDEVLVLGQDELAPWMRDAAPVSPDAWKHAESSDARWCWVIVLLLLGVEAVLRRRRPRKLEAVADAA